jgi:hypothetical protein
LLVTELMSNAVRHARNQAGQPLRLRATTLHIEVWDRAPTAPSSPGHHGDPTTPAAAVSGLNLVAVLSSDSQRAPRRRRHHGLVRAAGHRRTTAERQ